MEQDLKDIELFIDFCRAPYNFEHESDAKSYKELSNKIEHLIKAYKELEEENEVWKNSYYEQKEFNNRQALYIAEKFIPVSLVEEKIEEIKNETWYIDCGVEAKQSCIEVLQELLEKR